MLVTPFRTWLVEQEQRRRPLIFLLEWLGAFALSMSFWTPLVLKIQASSWSIAAAFAMSSVYASGLVYVRLLKLATCKRCHSPLIFSQEMSRRFVRELERCLEIERGGQEWCGHFIDLYSRRYRIEIVKYRCRRCHTIWQRESEIPNGEYELVRTMEVLD
jgi:RNase P subunit RPR2